MRAMTLAKNKGTTENIISNSTPALRSSVLLYISNTGSAVRGFRSISLPGREWDFRKWRACFRGDDLPGVTATESEFCSQDLSRASASPAMFTLLSCVGAQISQPRFAAPDSRPGLESTWKGWAVSAPLGSVLLPGDPGGSARGGRREPSALRNPGQAVLKIWVITSSHSAFASNHVLFCFVKLKKKKKK